MTDNGSPAPPNQKIDFQSLELLSHILRCLGRKDPDHTRVEFMKEVREAVVLSGHEAVEAIQVLIKEVIQSKGEDEDKHDRYTAAIPFLEKYGEVILYAAHNINSHRS